MVCGPSVRALRLLPLHHPAAPPPPPCLDEPGFQAVVPQRVGALAQLERQRPRHVCVARPTPPTQAGRVLHHRLAPPVGGDIGVCARRQVRGGAGVGGLRGCGARRDGTVTRGAGGGGGAMQGGGAGLSPHGGLGSPLGRWRPQCGPGRPRLACGWPRPKAAHPPAAFLTPRTPARLPKPQPWRPRLVVSAPASSRAASWPGGWR